VGCQALEPTPVSAPIERPAGYGWRGVPVPPAAAQGVRGRGAQAAAGHHEGPAAGLHFCERACVTRLADSFDAPRPGTLTAALPTARRGCTGPLRPRTRGQSLRLHSVGDHHRHNRRRASGPDSAQARHRRALARYSGNRRQSPGRRAGREWRSRGVSSRADPRRRRPGYAVTGCICSSMCRNTWSVTMRTPRSLACRAFPDYVYGSAVTSNAVLALTELVTRRPAAAASDSILVRGRLMSPVSTTRSPGSSPVDAGRGCCAGLAAVWSRIASASPAGTPTSRATSSSSPSERSAKSPDGRDLGRAVHRA
jgi:hypothetical protein